MPILLKYRSLIVVGFSWWDRWFFLGLGMQPVLNRPPLACGFWVALAAANSISSSFRRATSRSVGIDSASDGQSESDKHE